MKKFFYAFITFIIVLLFTLYMMLFTNFGNSVVANIIENKIKENTGLELDITYFNLRFSSLEFKLNFANIASLSLEGDLNLFKLGFDLDYIISPNQNYAKKLGLDLNKNLNFSGKIQGKASDFILDGKGYFLSSNILFNARMYDYNLIALNLDANNIKIEELLQILSYPIYAKGFLDAQVKISEQDLKPDGNIIIKLDTNYINYETIRKDFSLILPENFNPRAEFIADVKNDKINAIGKIYNDYFLLQTQKTLYDIKQNALNVDFKLLIPSLAKLEKLTKKRLNGSVSVLGGLGMINHVLSALNIDIIGLGEEIKVNFKNNKLFAKINNGDLKKLLALLGYSGLIDGNLNAQLLNADLDFSNFDFQARIDDAKLHTKEFKKITKIEFPDTIFSLDTKLNAKNNSIFYDTILNSNLLNITKLNGTYDLKNRKLHVDLNAFINDLSQFFIIAGMPNYANGVINLKLDLDDLALDNLSGRMNLEAKGVLNATILSKILNKKFPNNVDYDFNTRLDFKNNIAYFDTILNSSLVNLTDFKGSFDINKMLLNSDFVLNVNDFSKLDFLLDKKLKGKARFNGKLDFDKSFNFTLNSSNLFKGKLQSTFKNNLLFVNLNEMDLSDLSQSLDFIDFYQGKADLKAHYNLLSKTGEINLDMKDGKLKPNIITNVIKILIFKDITHDLYHSSNAKALIDKENIQLDLNMQASRSYISIKSGVFNSKNKTLNLPFDIKFDRANFKGSVVGTMQNPKIKLDAQSVLNLIKNVTGSKANDNAKDINNKINKAIDKLLN